MKRVIRLALLLSLVAVCRVSAQTGVGFDGGAFLGESNSLPLTPIPTESPTPTAYVPTQTPIPTSTPTFYVPTPTPTPTPMATATPLSYGAPVLRATNSGTIPYLSGGFNCVLPAGTANGDMVFCAFQDPDAGTVTPPSGYAAVTGSPVKLGDADLYVYWHAYSTGDPTTVAFGFTGVTDGLWESVGYENASSTFDGTPTTNTSATGAVQCPSITVAGNSDRLVLFGDAYISGTVLSFSYTSALTQQAITNEGPDWNWITEADAALSSSGSTGAAIMTASGGTPGYMACLMLALNLLDRHRHRHRHLSKPVLSRRFRRRVRRRRLMCRPKHRYRLQRRRFMYLRQLRRPHPWPRPLLCPMVLLSGATNSGTIPYLSGGFNCVLPAGTANGDMVFCAFSRSRCWYGDAALGLCRRDRFAGQAWRC